MTINSFKDLKAWQLGMDVTECVYRLTENFPKSEIYGLSSQMRRSAVSIPSNLAEGQGRESSKEFLHFIAISIGSICELETQLLIAHRLNYAPSIDIESIITKLAETGRMIRGLQKSIKAKLVTSH
jgi:four helix bundle protein